MVIDNSNVARPSSTKL